MKLTLFFTGGVSMATWAETGIHQREVAIYRCLGESGMQVAFVTYGDARDLRYAGHLGGEPSGPHGAVYLSKGCLAK